MFTENFFKNTVTKMTEARIKAEGLAVELELTKHIKLGNIRIEMQCDQLGAGDMLNAPTWNYQAFVTYPAHDEETKRLRQRIEVLEKDLKQIEGKLISAENEVRVLRSCKERLGKISEMLRGFHV